MPKINCRARYIAIWALLVAQTCLSACSKKQTTEDGVIAKKEISGELLVDSSNDPRSPVFEKLINAAEPETAHQLIEHLHQFDPIPDPAPKGEFETTADYERRLSEITKKVYSRKCLATVTAADFSYDADTRVMTFKEEPGNDIGNTHHLNNITFDDSLNGDGVPLVVSIVPGKAKLIPRGDNGLGGEAKLKVVRVWSLNGVAKPALSDWGNINQALDDEEDGMARSIAEKDRAGGQDEMGQAINKIDNTELKIKAKLLSVRIFSRDTGGVASPIFSWYGKSQAC